MPDKNKKEDGFDFCPLSLNAPDNKEMADFARKKSVTNVIQCYTNYWDLLAELVQNSMDAITVARRKDAPYEAKIYIEIDLGLNTVLVADNGCGMSEEAFLYFAAPDVTTKCSEQTLRGNKGVGATFLTYAFDGIQIHTKSQCGFRAKTSLIGGRTWLNDTGMKLGDSPRMRTYEGNVADNFIDRHQCGTAIFVQIGSQRPNLSHCNMKTASSWLSALRTKTAIGQVNISSDSQGLTVSPEISISIRRHGEVLPGGEMTIADSAHFFYPHEITDTEGEALRVADIKEIDSAFKQSTGDDASRREKNPQFYDLDMIYGIWTTDELLSSRDLSISSTATDDSNTSYRDLLEQYQATMYACFSASADSYKQFNEKVGIHGNYQLLKGGLQICTSMMPQGPILEIQLKRYSGDQNNVLVLIHFDNADPDLGRKGFQPQLHKVSQELAKKFTEHIRKKYKGLLTNRTGTYLRNERTLREWMVNSANHAITSPLPSALSNNDKTCALASLGEPLVEQDVVALFSQLLATELLPGLKILATSENKTYDTILRVDFENKDVAFSANNPFGISPAQVEGVRGDDTEGKYLDWVVEYKYNFHSLIAELDQEKHADSIDGVVCWKSEGNLGTFNLQPIDSSDRNSRKKLPGATHIARESGTEIFEVIVLETLITELKQLASTSRQG